MRLRIRFDGVTHSVVAESENITFSSFISTVQRVFTDDYNETPKVILSLNNQNPLIEKEEEEQKTLKELGLTCGDLLFVLNEFDIAHAAERHGRSLADITNSGSEEEQLDHPTEVESSTIPRSISSCSSSSGSASQSTSRKNSTGSVLDGSHSALAVKNNEPTNGCRGWAGVPERLEDVYASAQVETLSDALMVAIHCCLLESGFIVAGNGMDGNGMAMPHDWKTASAYSLQYYHSISGPSNPITVKAVSLGRHLFVHSMMSLNQSNIHTLSAVVTQYVRDDRPLTIGPSVYHQLNDLFKNFKEHLGDPLLVDIRESVGIINTSSLIGLMPELQLLILRYLPASSLCALSATCKQFHLLANDQALWKRLYNWTFKTQPQNVVKGANWKRLYEEAVKTHQYNRRTRSRQPLFFDAPPSPIWNHGCAFFGGSLLPHVPGRGIIGGEYDRLPAFPFGPHAIGPMAPLTSPGPFQIPRQ
eukprot:Ihof_evm1s370 gene=Ihof_evmTU1s370